MNRLFLAITIVGIIVSSQAWILYGLGWLYESTDPDIQQKIACESSVNKVIYPTTDPIRIEYGSEDGSYFTATFTESKKPRFSSAPDGGMFYTYNGCVLSVPNMEIQYRHYDSQQIETVTKPYTKTTHISYITEGQFKPGDSIDLRTTYQQLISKLQISKFVNADWKTFVDK